MTVYVVTVCGHVDSGKTRFIENIVQLNLVNKEYGQITQKLSIYETTTKLIIEKNKLSEKIKNLKLPEKIIFLDTPGHTAFETIKNNAFDNSNLVLVLNPLCQKIHESNIDILKILKTKNIPFMLIFTKLDEVPNWNNGIIFRKNIENNLEQYNHFYYKRMLELSEQDLDIKLYETSLNESYIPYTAISNVTKEGYYDLFTILLKQYETIKKSNKKIVLLDCAISHTLYYTGIIYEGTLKTKEVITYEHVDYKIKNIYLKPYQGLFKVKEVTGPAVIGIETNLKNSSQNSLSGLILKGKTKGALEGLANKIKEFNWPIRNLEIGRVNKLNRLNIKNEKPPYNYILAFYKGQDTDNELYDESIFKLIQKVKNKIDNYKETELSKIKINYNFAKIEFVEGSIFKTKIPYVLGFRLIDGFFSKNSSFKFKNISFKILELQKDNKSLEFVEEKNITFAIKLTSNNTIKEIILQPYFLAVVDLTELKLYKEYLPVNLWNTYLTS
jgi:translation initiation factor IF-2